MKYGWWSYVKYMIRQYTARKIEELRGVECQEQIAVQAAIEQTERMENGQSRMKIIGPVLLEHTHTIQGAAIFVPCSERTAQRWCSDFIKMVAKNFSCDRLIS